MSIDEAIAHAREVASEQKRRSGICVQNNSECDKFSACLKCFEEHEQLAEWLEDYKRIKMLIPIEQALKNEYNKAIDDLQNELKNHYTEYIIDCVLADTGFYSYTTACNYLEDYIDKIAEKLKRGGENESSN